jgi:phospholipid/cholesterol/gamma-HCH transport system substrate-binding protein
VSARRRSHRNELLVGVLFLLALFVFAWLAVQIGSFRGVGGNLRVRAVFPDAAGLVEEAAVKVAGVKVGSVAKLEVDFDKAVAILALRKDAGIRRDVRAEIRARSLLGEKYVALIPQSRDAALLVDGGEIADTVPSVEMDQIVQSLGPVLQKVDPDDVARLVHDLAALSGEAHAQAPEILRGTKDLLGKLNIAADAAPAVREDLPALLSDLRGTARDLGGTLAKADAALDRASAVIEKADTATEGLPQTVADVREMVAAVKPAMDDVYAALDQSDEAVAALRKVLDNFGEFDEEAIRKLLREDGVLIRLREPRGAAAGASSDGDSATER